MRSFYLYGHFIPETDECYYIGKGGGSKRETGSNYRRSNELTGRNVYHKTKGPIGK